MHWPSWQHVEDFATIVLLLSFSHTHTLSLSLLYLYSRNELQPGKHLHFHGFCVKRHSWVGCRALCSFTLSFIHFPSFESVLSLLNCGQTVTSLQTLCKLPSLQPHKTHRSSFEILHSCGESLNFAEGFVYSCPKIWTDGILIYELLLLDFAVRPLV